MVINELQKENKELKLIIKERENAILELANCYEVKF